MNSRWKPFGKRRLIAFSVPEKERFKGSTLYTPRSNVGAYSETTEVWILDWTRDCLEPWKKGDRVLIPDGFELEPTDLDLWELHKNDPEFADLEKFVQDVGGRVKTEIVAEGSILATLHP